MLAFILQIVTLDLYSLNDLTLGYYIEHLCLDPKFRCDNPACDMPIEKHVRFFVHGEARIVVGCVNNLEVGRCGHCP